MSHRDNIIEMIDRQILKGKSKYGQLLEDNVTLTTDQRLEHMQEELIDALMYTEHLRAIKGEELTANDFQRAAMRTASGMDYDGSGENALLLNGVMGLNGEAGECIDIMKKHIFQGHELNREHMIEELGDVAWYLAVCCEGLGVTLEQVMRGNIEKLMKRYPEGFDKARSINRQNDADCTENEREDEENAAVSEKVHKKTYLEDFLENSPTLTAEDVIIGLCVKERYKSIPETSRLVCDKNCHGCWNSAMPEEK